MKLNFSIISFYLLLVFCSQLQTVFADTVEDKQIPQADDLGRPKPQVTPGALVNHAGSDSSSYNIDTTLTISRSATIATSISASDVSSHSTTTATSSTGSNHTAAKSNAGILLAPALGTVFILLTLNIVVC
ncbi:uncharacterized protein CANTADRAFT_25270 [Suhomyces tanzawaensis NRRL Y-17324]|uniref:Uncharacterized protein n=1 Tax=Suhomyces tanzawaensis NRRL Y-17324 TaxID=984487 RepID=A0A1E4SN70_9ASCO|nr:uncharacterized protein CANTADRAFT_25270 [Suhomyces tanzawaensis NRRL Y-17324]ODV80945.1 hypothetical protein CANTADRAFT_25270 [Suhomyces tanzawaensis NRRL Y-17324]